MKNFREQIQSLFGLEICQCATTGIVFIHRPSKSVESISEEMVELAQKNRAIKKAQRRAEQKRAHNARKTAAKKAAHKLGRQVKQAGEKTSREVRGRALHRVLVTLKEAVLEHGREVGRYLALIVCKHTEIKKCQVEAWHLYKQL